MSFASRNVNSLHRISLKTNWKVDAQTEQAEPSRMDILAFRSFHRPTGLSNGQIVRFCLEPALADLHFLINGFSRPLIVIGGLASVPITDLMESINRVELRWRGDPMTTPQLPEHFGAWLEISDVLLTNESERECRMS